MRILMLHGYAESGQKFEMKTGPLRRCLEEACISIELESVNKIEYIYPTAPIRLDPSDFVGVDAEPSEHCDTWGWWLGFDRCEIGLNKSLEALSALVQSSGPVDAVIGFSQGAALAALFASLCESETRPERRKALREQKRPIEWTTAQNHLKFAICISGFAVTKDLYSGYYEPRIRTPILFVAGTLDFFVPLEHTRRVLQDCENAVILEHHGTHYVPRFRPVLDNVGDFVKNVLDGNDVSRHTMTNRQAI